MPVVSWSKAFPEPIALHAGRALRTLREAGEYIRELPPGRQARPTWTYATELLLIAVRTGKKADIIEACNQVGRAAHADGLTPRRKVRR